jgi:hypothetical protein
VEPPLLRNLDDPDSNTPPTFDFELNDMPSSDSEQSDASKETSAESEDNLDLEDGASDILQEEDDPEATSRHQLLSIYTDDVTSCAESDDLNGVFDSPGSSTSLPCIFPFDAPSLDEDIDDDLDLFIKLVKATKDVNSVESFFWVPCNRSAAVTLIVETIESAIKNQVNASETSERSNILFTLDNLATGLG